LTHSALTTFSDLVSEAREQIHADALTAGLPDDNVPLREGSSDARAYAEAVSVYLATVISKATVASNTLARWRPGESKTAPAFGRQAIPMVWDYAETNPFAGAGDDFFGIAEGTSKAIEKLPAASKGTAEQANAAQKPIKNEAIVISTDPPYYDNIGYADLSDFSYVWLRPVLRDTYPELFGTLLVPKDEELVATPYRFGGDKSAANRHFETGLAESFAHMRRAVDVHYPLTVYYAFKQAEEENDDDETGGEGYVVSSTGWETMLEGVIRSGFMTHLIQQLDAHGESGSAALLMRMHSDLAAEAKNPAYRLYQICERKGWAEYALEYNALVQSWPGLQEEANRQRRDQPPEQLGLF